MKAKRKLHEKTIEKTKRFQALRDTEKLQTSATSATVMDDDFEDTVNLKLVMFCPLSLENPDLIKRV